MVSENWQCIFCRRCGYRLTGLTQKRCPECGLSFHPDNPRTFRRLGESRWGCANSVVLGSAGGVLFVALSMVLLSGTFLSIWAFILMAASFPATFFTLTYWALVQAYSLRKRGRPDPSRRDAAAQAMHGQDRLDLDA
ncbi:MAG: hypothetical protein WD042_15165 [Phycisphaeraceae bacterium]